MQVINTKFIKAATTVALITLVIALFALDSSNNVHPEHPYYLQTNTHAIAVYTICIWVSVCGFGLAVVDYVLQSFKNNTK